MAPDAPAPGSPAAPPSSPRPAGSPRPEVSESDEPEYAQTFAGRAVELVLRACRDVDPGARIASVLRDSDGRTVIRVRSTAQSSEVPSMLLSTMRAAWPLSQTSVVNNALDGTCEAEIVIPTASDQASRARLQAKRSLASRALMHAARLLMIVGTLMYAHDLVSAATETAANGTAPAHNEEL